MKVSYSWQSDTEAKFNRRAYIDARYSMHYEITEEELVYLQGEVEKLKRRVEQVCLTRLEG